MAKKKKTATRQQQANRLEIENFKSIKHIEIETSRVNVFIGRPNSGKSNLLEAMTLFNFIQDKSHRQNEPSVIRYNTLDNLFYDRNLAKDIQIEYGENLTILSFYGSVLGYKGPNHADNIYQVLSLLVSGKLKGKAIGFIGNDKRKPPSFKEFKVIDNFKNVKLLKHDSKEYYLVMVNPAMDKFI